MIGKFKSVLSNAVADLKAGVTEVSTQSWRLTRAAGHIFAGGLRGAISRLPTRRRLKKLGINGAALLGSATVWLLMAGLATNIRFAAAVLPEANVDLWSVNRPASITVYDRDGELIGSRGSTFSDPVPLEDLPPYVIDAFIATEDRRFFDHHGFDLRGLARAVVVNMQAGGVVEGGSTITQQLAKNLFLEYDRTLIRKLREIQIAFWLEARLSKTEILELYLNRIYLGGGAYGIEPAANLFFSKSARDLTVAEAAILAGLPKAPSELSPTINMQGAIARSHTVIDNLLEVNRIDYVTASVAKLNPPDLNLRLQSNREGYFLDYVYEELKARFGGTIGQDMIVTSTLDSRLQAAAVAAVNNAMTNEALVRGAEQAALIAYDAQGGIVAMVGGRDYTESPYNRAVQARRQPGSAFKPFVFLAAMEAGMSADSIVVDQAISVGDWEPSNYTDRHLGPMRLSSAVARSINTVAVQVTEAIGRDRVIDAARRAGITSPLAPHASLALGAMELTLDELTAAYLPFAHEGAEVPPHGIAKVTSRTGTVLYDFKPIDGFYVIDTEDAREVTEMLMQVTQSGTGAGANLGERQTAGKTGTTNNWRDAWFIGFTADLTAGVWVGNDDAKPMNKVTGGSIPLDIWRDFMISAHEGLPPRPLFDGAIAASADTSRLSAYYEGLRADLFDISYPTTNISSWDDYLNGNDEREPPRRQRGDLSRPSVQGRAAPGVQPSSE
ncbi:PBP1A family penicillin-binding protein [Parvularcula sp. LCG005]|uniref:transglycosylase domain-containing protein n=1 Tax=Parvularcula sp. LCG005 TaxID=3078805 RepID=UPI002943D5C1|nr:PBP1A family penicillin-binding protein [Parvularcula sp. LCG005]WOI53986.1 PBP1A family penicillin-binding protein [Parvularcula sp. LCG005]